MKKFKSLGIIFAIVAILLSDYMCAVVAYNWCAMEYAIKYQGFSAPANTSLFFAIPFLIGIIICITLSIVSFKKAKQTTI